MDLFDQLLTMPGDRGVSPETLELLGRRAALDFVERGVPLNEGVVKVASEHPGLKNEHVKRIAEFANNVAFQHLFEKSANKNVHFTVADPGVVLRDLRDGGSTKTAAPMKGNNLDDYKRPPPARVPGSPDGLADDAGDESDDAITTAFEIFRNTNANSGQYGQGQAHVKTASAKVICQGHANPVDDLYDLHVQLMAAKEKLASAVATFSATRSDAEEDFYQTLKREVLDPDGAGLGGSLGALRQFADEGKLASIMPRMTERLLADGVYPKTLERSMTKTAGAVANPNHRLVRSFAGMVKAAQEQVRAELGLREIEGHLKQTSAALRKCA